MSDIERRKFFRVEHLLHVIYGETRRKGDFLVHDTKMFAEFSFVFPQFPLPRNQRENFRYFKLGMFRMFQVFESRVVVNDDDEIETLENSHHFRAFVTCGHVNE